MRATTGWGFLLAMAVSSAMASAAAEESTTPLARGEALLATNCSRCHAVGRAAGTHRVLDRTRRDPRGGTPDAGRGQLHS